MEMMHSATRALALLESLNKRSISYVRELAQDTGVSKPSVVRLMGILAEQGYVEKVGGGAYSLGPSAPRLVSGYNGDLPLITASRPVMDRLTAEIGWPSALGLAERAAMVVRYSTISTSPLAWYRTTLFQRLSLIRSAMGQAILAFEPENVREMMIEASEDSDDVSTPLDKELLLNELDRVKRRGFAIRRPGFGHTTMSISVPLLIGSRPMAGLSVTLFGGAMTPELAADRFAERLVQTASEIVAATDQ